MRKFKVIIFLLQFIVVPSTAIWVIVEFLIYLFKDLPFNWWSFGVFITNITAMSIFMLIDIGLHVRRKIREEKERLEKIERITSKQKKSKFQTRLEEVMRASEEQKRKDNEMDK